MKATLFKLIAFIVVVSMSFSAAGAQSIPEGDESTVPDSKLQFSPVTGEKITIQSIGKSETGLYIIRLKDPALASYNGGILNLAPTAPEKTGAEKLDVYAPASIKYSDYLELQQGKLVDTIEKNLSHSVQVKYSYKNVLNAIAVEMSKEEAETVAALPGVVAIYPDQIRQLDTEVSVDLIGAPAVWDGYTGTGLGTKGEGIIVGMIDSGINHAHPSFADIGGDGYDHTNPKSGYLGVCDPTHPNHIPNFCNDKLIGAYNFYPGITSPEDVAGHGSHTASTAAGNIHEADIEVGTSTFNLTVQGVAPHANLIAYKVCHPSCPNTSSVAAVDQAIADGVDVLNYSISGSDDPWNDIVDLAFLDAFNAGIFVSASAGNDGPGASTVAKTGGWNASVGNSTTSRIIANTLDVISPEHQLSLEGMAALQGTGPALSADIQAEIASFDNSNLTGCDSFPEGFFTGKIALIQRGGCNFSVKVANAEAAGAVVVIVFNNAGGPPFVMGELEDTTIPSAMLDKVDGDALKLFVSTNPGTVARFNASASYIVRPAWQDVMNSSSSRGPSQFEMIKPDYVAPGTNILAAVSASGSDPAQYDFYSGTSMAAPHGAGSAALLIALHPDWSPAEIKSALASTAYDQYIENHDGEEAGFFDRGSGRLSLADAAYTGLVMDESYQNFVDANPDLGGDPKTLNLPSMADYACIGECSWTRTVTNMLPFQVTYTASIEGITPTDAVTVTPSMFTLEPGESQILAISVDANLLPLGQYTFGNLVLTTDATYLESNPVTFLSEGFESLTFPPIDWVVYDEDGLNPQWALTNAEKYTGSQSVFHDRSGNLYQDGWLVTPALDLESQTEMKFWERKSPHVNYDHSLWVCTEDCTNPPINWTEVTGFTGATTTWAEQTVDLSAYDGQNVQFAFHYEGSSADTWYIDDVRITGIPDLADIPDQHFPIAVFSAAGSAPYEVNIDTRRDAGSVVVDDFLSLGTTDLTIREFGLVKAEFVYDLFEQDDFFAWIVPVNPGDKRFITEIIETTSQDLDLYVGIFDGSITLSDDLVCISATDTAYEKCDLLNPISSPTGYWYIAIHNYQASSITPDPVLFSIGIVPNESAGNMTVDGPATIAYRDPFSVQIAWNEPELEEGDIYYGAFDLGLTSENPGNIGTVRVNLNRYGDDVTKSVDSEEAFVGDELTYTIAVQPSLKGEELTYTITDTIPTGLTYITDSATNGAVVEGNVLSWSGLVADESVEITYKTTVDKNPHGTVLINEAVHDNDELGSIEEVASTEVTVLNSAPQFADIPDLQGNVGDPLTFTAVATDPDVPLNTLTYSLERAPADAEIDPDTGIFTWTPTLPDVYTFDVVVNDGTGTSNATDKETISVTVGPLLYAIGDKVVDEGEELTFTAAAGGSGVYTFAIEDIPVGASFNTETGAFAWTPGESNGGLAYDVTINVSDGTTTDSEIVKITVNEVNVAPVLAPIGNKQVTLGNSVSFTAGATDGDLPVNILTYSLDGAPGDAMIDGDTGDFYWTPDAVGGYTFIVVVSDGEGGTDEETITITVIDQEPIIYYLYLPLMNK
ncbi:MAG: DUF11 domain-containing protein [Chloroflexi bacterium]|nr:MAG: DUF11 domain-containing protein [Chloroflexota bacterium]